MIKREEINVESKFSLLVVDLLGKRIGQKIILL